MSSGKQPPMGWWQGDDGGWYPPDTHPDRAWRTLFGADRHLPAAARPLTATAGSDAVFPRPPPGPTRSDDVGPADPTWAASVAAAVGDGPADAAIAGPADGTTSAGTSGDPSAPSPRAGRPTPSGTDTPPPAQVTEPAGPPAPAEPGAPDGGVAAGPPTEAATGTSFSSTFSWTSLANRRLGAIPLWAALGAVVLIVLLARNAFSGDTSGEPDRPPAGARPTAVELSSAAPEASSTTTTPPAAPRRSTMPVLTGLTGPGPASVAAAAANHVEGSGSGRVAVAKPAPGMVVARMAYGGTGPFAVHRLDDAGRRIDALITTVGAYGGSRLFDTDGGETTQLEIVADGPWSVDLIALPGAATWSGREPASGQGDGVLVVPGGLSRFTVVQVAHTGVRSFVVSAYTATTRDLVASGVGRHDTRHALAPGVLVLAITADGAWSITPRTA